MRNKRIILTSHCIAIWKAVIMPRNCPLRLSHTRGDALSYRKRTPSLRYSATRETTKQYHNVGTSHSCEGSSEHNHKHPNSTLTCLFCSYCIIYWIHMGSGIQKRLHIQPHQKKKGGEMKKGERENLFKFTSTILLVMEVAWLLFNLIFCVLQQKFQEK